MCRCLHDGIQQISYAKGSSHVIAKLRGTYVPSTAPTADTGVSTDLQKSVFGGPPSAITAKPSEAAEGGKEGEQKPPQGVKRPREEESDEEEAPMDEESDVPMEASSDED